MYYSTRSAAAVILGLGLVGCGASSSPNEARNDFAVEQIRAEIPDTGRKGLCVAPVNPELAVVSAEAGAACISCTATDADSILQTEGTGSSRLNTFVSLLGAGADADLRLTTQLAEPVDPTTVQTVELVTDADETLIVEVDGTQPGYTVSFPDAALASVAVLPDLIVETLLDGVVVDSAAYPFGFQNNVALGTLAQDINNAQVYLPVTATGPYDAVRLTVTSLVASVLLNVDAHRVCTFGVAGSISGDF